MRHQYWVELVVGVVLGLLLVGLLIIFFVGCDVPSQQQRTPPTVVVFYEYVWELTDSTRHHAAQPANTKLHRIGDVVVLADGRHRYPFLVPEGTIAAPVTDYEAPDTYSVWYIQWCGDSGDWRDLRHVVTPGLGILWVQLDSTATDGDFLRLVRL